MRTSTSDDRQRLAQIVASSPDLMAQLRAVRALGLPHGCIGAGAIRTLVWDRLHHFDAPSTVEDVDVVYFDAKASPAQDAQLQARLQEAMPALNWEVTNQAWVHQWFSSALGVIVPPLASLEEGIATWPEFATCVGVFLHPDASIGVVAPHGLVDLFQLRVRHNPARASAATYRQRVQSKRFGERWPRLCICEPVACGSTASSAPRP